VAVLATQQYTAWQQYATATQQALAADDVLTARERMQHPPAATAVANYNALYAQERAVVASYSVLSERDMSAVLPFLSSSQRATLHSATLAVTNSVNRFSVQPFTQTNQTFTQLAALQTQLTENATASAETIVRTGESLLHAEQRMACTLKTGTCPPEPAFTFTSLAQAQATLNATCADLRTLPAFFAQRSALYEAEVTDMPATEDSFDAVAIRAAARNGTLATENVSVRLAVPLVTSDETVTFIAAHCGLITEDSLPPPPTPTLTLPAPSPQQVNAAVAGPRCCTDGVCSSCTRTTYPVVFVHGHSVTDTTSPEYNLNAFTTMAIALQDEGYLYGGHIFPREDLTGVPYAEFRGLPVLFTATYYYDSYPEEGGISLVSSKSENIETYSIRLKEAIDVAKHKTGSPKVVIVAHSMGGLVTRRYVQLFGEDDVAAIILIGTPNYGIVDRTESLCPLFGGEKECTDMTAGSVFLSKLNHGAQPTVPVYTYAGIGCDGRAFDGVVEADNVALPFATNTRINGTCTGSRLLHSGMLDPADYPSLYDNLVAQLTNYTMP
jgi:hypothetical protein